MQHALHAGVQEIHALSPVVFKGRSAGRRIPGTRTDASRSDDHGERTCTLQPSPSGSASRATTGRGSKPAGGASTLLRGRKKPVDRGRDAV